ncbi:TetR/AcrR family transcriptional regulator [Natronoglycomyces albus]|uniref:TetR/AcrR family transcriptional regulator C-terminal domain-containing protein n=1 Tax=Natronoglycomyces albus TaxID=2811108 RepID=A0A895XHY7_9ACTN|nr:TetR/AcrR family transcriptional regulator [Natronoglycomyces albus]QSB04557.1 TetR/AcrR family transcriptional regulator C-terminal domain-containing protein [Natronoglycomyces albus]
MIWKQAISLADAEGIASVTMRRVASKLGVATMTLYRFFPSKFDLVSAMVEQVLSSYERPQVEPAGWRAQLEYEARQEWRLYRRHPWLLGLLAQSRPPLTPRLLQAVERTMAILANVVACERRDPMWLYLTLSAYVQGAAMLPASEDPSIDAIASTAGDVVPYDSTRRFEEFSDQLASGRFPHLASQFPLAENSAHPQRLTDKDDVLLGFDQWFEYGLARVLDGIEHYFFSQRDHRL